MTINREQKNIVSRRSFLTTAFVALAGTAGSSGLAASPALAGTGGDAVLIDAWAKHQEAWAHMLALSKRSEPMFKAALASLPEHPFEVAMAAKEVPEGMNWQTLSHEERMIWEDIRGQQYQEAFDKYGVTAVQKEQDRFLETVVDPLAETIRNMAPTTVKGVAIKTAYLRDHEPDEALWDFIDQLAGEA
jgi:hypothetical protein